MNGVLFLSACEEDGSLGNPALESLGVACRLAADLGTWLEVGLFGACVEPGASQTADSGARRFLAVSGAAFGQSRYVTDAAAAEVICRVSGAMLVIAPCTFRLQRCLPGVAYRLGGRADTHVTSVGVSDGMVIAQRWYYRQRIEATFTRVHRPWIILVDPGAVPAWSGTSRPVQVEFLRVELPESAIRTDVKGVREPETNLKTIRPDADLLFVAGAGWTKKQIDGKTHVAEAEQLILEFLNLTKCSLGSSKSLVELGSEGQAVLSFLSHLNQIGQTGSTPRHRKGLATCCHGEEPHTIGWRFINERRAINVDPQCGWARGKADVLYVADAFAVMKRVNELLREG
ncbi:MAG: electron transfer flavoprotein subunit alpha [Verrucomicrobiae bacterium]|nr:electron transfer flavoprotein subunit alpha [Verrucomicrobiae bacterium]